MFSVIKSSHGHSVPFIWNIHYIHLLSFLENIGRPFFLGAFSEKSIFEVVLFLRGGGDQKNIKFGTSILMIFEYLVNEKKNLFFLNKKAL